MRSASTVCSKPRPPQCGQAPKGLLKENSRGSISGMVKPETGQANLAEKMMRFGAPFSSFSSAIFGDGDAVGEFQRGLEAFRRAAA